MGHRDKQQLKPLFDAGLPYWETLIKIGVVSVTEEYCWASLDSGLKHGLDERRAKKLNECLWNCRSSFCRAKHPDRVLHNYLDILRGSVNRLASNPAIIEKAVLIAERHAGNYWYCPENETRALRNAWQTVATMLESVRDRVLQPDTISLSLKGRYLKAVCDVKGAARSFGFKDPALLFLEDNLFKTAKVLVGQLSPEIEEDPAIAEALGRYWHNTRGPSSDAWGLVPMMGKPTTTPTVADRVIRELERSSACYVTAAKLVPAKSDNQRLMLLEAAMQFGSIMRWYLRSGRPEFIKDRQDELTDFSEKYEIPDIQQAADLFRSIDSHTLLFFGEKKRALDAQDAAVARMEKKFGEYHHLTISNKALLYHLQKQHLASANENLRAEITLFHKEAAIQQSDTVDWAKFDQLYTDS